MTKKVINRVSFPGEEHLSESKWKAFWSGMNLILEKHNENQCGWCLVVKVSTVPSEGREWWMGAIFASVSLKLSQIKYSFSTLR